MNDNFHNVTRRDDQDRDDMVSVHFGVSPLLAIAPIPPHANKSHPVNYDLAAGISYCAPARAL